MQHVVRVTDGFPFECPKVCPDPPLAGPLWHMEVDGNLCLYVRGEGVGRPWEDVDALLAKVSRWHEQTSLGWPADPGDLDLERYFPSTGETLVAYDDLDALVGRNLDLSKAVPGVYVAKPGRSLGSVSAKQAKRDRRAARDGDLWGAAVCLGTLANPVNDWDGILARVDADARTSLRSLAATRSTGILLVRYSRNIAAGEATGAAAIMVNEAGAVPGRAPTVTALRVEDRRRARRNRAGADAPMLAKKRVAVVGCGAIGSFLAEHLARSGVGHLTLVDGDYVRYGNCVRHLVDESFVGRPKSDAVRTVLASRNLIDPDNVTCVPRSLRPEDAVGLFADHDLVVDATAESSVYEVLTHFSDETGGQWVKVGLHRAGTVMRADRYGPKTTRREWRPAPIARVPGPPGVRETGCGDPVSPTPPASVHAAAALGCRMAIDALRDRRQRQLPDTIVETLAPHAAPDSDPYRHLGMEAW